MSTLQMCQLFVCHPVGDTLMITIRGCLPWGVLSLLLWSLVVEKLF